MGLKSVDKDRQTANEYTAGMTYVVIPAQFNRILRAERRAEPEVEAVISKATVFRDLGFIIVSSPFN
jgi:hypothetical protein